MPTAPGKREDALMSVLHETQEGHELAPPTPNLLLLAHDVLNGDDFKTNASARPEKLTFQRDHMTHHSSTSLSPTTAGAMRNRALVRPELHDPAGPISFPLDARPTKRQPVIQPHINTSTRWLPIPATFIRHSHSVFASPPAYLAYYFLLNLSLTLQNKHILLGFPFPYSLSAIHAFCSFVGCNLVVRTGSTPVPRLDTQENLALLSFSFLYTINIIISNVSLGLVTVPFHQVVRASVPFFIIAFSHILLGSTASKDRCISLIPVVAGVALATYGDYYFTPLGFLLTLLGTALAALKTIFTNVLQRPPSRSRSISDATPTKSPISPLIPNSMRAFRLPPFTPLQLLYLLSPLALVQSITIAYLSGESGEVVNYLFGSQTSNLAVTGTQLFSLVVNGCIAFVLNIASFNANKKVGALGMAVAGNVKQVLTILCAVGLFNLTITPLNGLGITLTLVGGAWYGYVEFREKEAKDKHLRFV